jgi:pSer/pThr/pTyr-binding forkhead associated (FHA) protein
VAEVVRGKSRGGEQRFTESFTIGRAPGCGVQVLEPGVAEHHLELVFDGVRWWARSLSAVGTYVGGEEIQMVPLQGTAELELGAGGPVVSVAEARLRRGFRSEEEIVARLRAPEGAPAGTQTLMLRRAVARVQRSSSRRYRVAVALATTLLAGAAAFGWHQHQRIQGLRSTAERLFYEAKAIELRTARLEALVQSDPRQAAELRERRARAGDLQREYDAFVQELGVYASASPKERLVLRMARTFGESEVNLPRGFVAEVDRYAERWKRSGWLAAALARARRDGYAAGIARTFAAERLPPQYLYVALQESGFDERAVGPATRHGFAKGMWQFIAPTGRRYGLRIGPRHAERAYDPHDERFEWQKATRAAARYIRDLTDHEAQGSGLLVMASYNWGEHNIRGILEGLPEDPRERNFWRLLADDRVPRETYDYVLSIFSAAVVCEDPKLFGFEGDCPRPGAGEPT